jgi:PAS domain S-box-containing protein
VLPNGRFLLSVQDNGPGVPPRLRRQIFDRFSQGQAEQSSAGSGLGLSIVKEFVELHNGNVAVIDAPETGAIFQIEIPIRAPNGAFFRARAREDLGFVHNAVDLLKPVAVRTSRKSGNTPHLLIVEDNPDLRQFLYDVLIDEYRVSLAENGAVALQLALTDPPDLIITDLMMPERSGEDFIRQLRAHSKGKQVPILVLSARADDALRENLLAELVQDYVTKPFSPQELMARVKNLVTVKKMVDLLQEELNSQASDISELTRELVASRKSLQEGFVALQMSERRWQGLYENTAVGIALVSSDGSIVKANPALQEMLGYGEEEINGISLIDITEESERVLTRQNVLGLIGGVIENYQVEKRYERKNGDYLWANVCGSLIPAIENEPPLIAVIVEDITSRKEAEDRLATTQSDLARVSRYTAMGELVATIAHEVNQPLSAIVTNSQAALRWLERERPNYEEVVAALQRVNRDAVLAGNVITRTRNFLKKGGIHPERVRLAPIIDSLLQILSRRLQMASVRVKVKISPNLPAFSADPVQLQQVLMNLVVNALDVLRERNEGLIYVEVDEALDTVDNGVLFTVRDTGPGIPADKRGQIFEPFFSTKSDGLGMGLAITRSIIENHGGDLWLEDDQQPGACFKFWLPANQST